MPTISSATLELYKTYGWQTTSNSSQASFVSDFLDIYENSFTKDVPPDMNTIPARTEKSVTVWFDYLENPETMDWDDTIEISLPEFPDATFRYNPYEIVAVNGEEVTQLYTGMPIWNTYFCDLTGDGFPEFCSTLSFGSGMIDNRVIIHDYANGESYELSDRGYYDYALKCNDADGQLYVAKASYFGGGIVHTGKLVLKDNQLQILGEVTTPSIIHIVDPTQDENFAYDTAVEMFFEDSKNKYYFSGIYSQYVIVHYADGTTEAISSALKNGRATLADLERFGIRFWAEVKENPLDAAISSTIMDHYANSKPDGLIHAESHVMLANEGMSETPVFEAGSHTEKVTVYLVVYHAKYSIYGGMLEEVESSYVPTAITFKVSDSGIYTLEEYWIPEEGGRYETDVRSRFPGTSADDALNEQIYFQDLKEQTYDKALAYVYSVSVDVRIEELLDAIQSFPAYSSNPVDYIRAHEYEYAELVSHGENTLRYCFSKFLQGGQTDLRGHIMARACQDIAHTLGEHEEALENVVMTGQDWFDNFYENALILEKNHTSGELETHYPVTYFLLRIRDNFYA